MGQLARSQAACTAGELTQRAFLLQNASRRREDTGVELYGQQQALVKAQTLLNHNSTVLTELADTRTGTEQQLGLLRQQCSANDAQLKANKHQVQPASNLVAHGRMQQYEYVRHVHASLSS